MLTGLPRAAGEVELGVRTHIAGRLRLFPAECERLIAAPRAHPICVRRDGVPQGARSARSAGSC